MDTTLLLGLAGLVATSGIGALGLYFTSRARSTSLRDALYARQLDSTVELTTLIGRIRLYITIALGDDAEYRQRAHDDLRESMPTLSTLTNVTAGIFPAEIFVSTGRISSIVADFIETVEKGEPSSEGNEAFVEESARLLLMLRQNLGADELSEESLKLFARRTSLDDLSRVCLASMRGGPAEESERKTV